MLGHLLLAALLAASSVVGAPSASPANSAADPLVHSGARSLEAQTTGNTTGWKTLTQSGGSVLQNTSYSIGAWLVGSGAITIKATTSTGANLAFIRPKATGTWAYSETSFSTGSYAGAVTFVLSDSAVAEYPPAEAAGTMYLDDVFFGPTGGSSVLANAGFEEQLTGWGGDRGSVFTRYPDRSDNPPAEQYDGINQIGAYAWDRNPAGVTDFGEWMGRTPVLAEDFLERNTWSDLEGGNRLAAWQSSAYADNMLLAAYPFPDSGGSLAESADGLYNSHYLALGENLMASGMSNASIRFGHEFNGNWYPWSIGNSNDPDHEQKAADFAESFRQFVTTLRSIPGQQFTFVWNPSTSVWGVDLPAAFPGRDYVDFVGIDHYDQTWATSAGTAVYGADYASADPAERLRRQQLAWTAEVSDTNWGLQMIADFAADQGVPVGLGEWGLALRSDGMGGGDNPYFIQKMHEWIENNNVAWHIYFNVSASDGDHDLYDTVTFPKASAAFSALWNPAGAPQTTPAIEPDDIPGASAPYKKVEAESGVLSGPVFKYHGDPWASAGGLALLYKGNSALTFTGVDAAPGGIAVVYQGWQSDQKASLYIDGVLAKKGILFAQHGRSWSGSYGSVVIDDVTVPEGATLELRIDPDDVLPNTDSLKFDYLLLLGAV
ncbi:MAG: hypothetical protein JWR01_1210 [Subtercola sp.]|nr:hypothetical protein [Subtercola sp.]